LTEEIRLDYKKYAISGGRLDEKPPHIWALAAKTFYQLFENDRKQAVCISGESGAGKTFGTKLVMSFMTKLFPLEQNDRDN
jgi:myosin heavy subunit